MPLITSIRNNILMLPLFIVACFISSIASAEDDAMAPVPVYIALTPDFVVNHISTGSRLRYIKASISVRADMSQQETIENNMPIIRDALVMFLSSRAEDQVKGALAREKTRQESVGVVNSALQEQIGISPIQDVLFSSFITQ
ncbi:flagellar basal body-associated FliL family protein [Marinomonas sp. C2222]|uniref:Flagellar protein FliL n=1 Tax=Marinomonas sargassi TaxID=2984494 RepID=A0ABT2YPP9_9GAMM|nr:flagellar basal body-associated FliL family protein [Marinomonas sargassi]MCV2401669.1 flagellar basal body-associated FliL family protein [Marinomonas sargassi]